MWDAASWYVAWMPWRRAVTCGWWDPQPCLGYYLSLGIYDSQIIWDDSQIMIVVFKGYIYVVKLLYFRWILMIFMWIFAGFFWSHFDFPQVSQLLVDFSGGERCTTSVWYQCIVQCSWGEGGIQRSQMPGRFCELANQVTLSKEV